MKNNWTLTSLDTITTIIKSVCGAPSQLFARAWKISATLRISPPIPNRTAWSSAKSSEKVKSWKCNKSIRLSNKKRRCYWWAHHRNEPNLITVVKPSLTSRRLPKSTPGQRWRTLSCSNSKFWRWQRAPMRPHRPSATSDRKSARLNSWQSSAPQAHSMKQAAMVVISSSTRAAVLSSRAPQPKKTTLCNLPKWRSSRGRRLGNLGLSRRRWLIARVTTHAQSWRSSMLQMTMKLTSKRTFQRLRGRLFRTKLI